MTLRFTDLHMARQRPEDLPNYTAPPVTEAVLGIQFAPIGGFASAYAGLFWQKIRPRYPKLSEQPPLASQFETFGGRPTPMTIQMQAMFSPPMPRFWFESEDGTQLVQLQQDRILHNWRKQNADDSYPQYEPIREKFIDEVAEFDAFLKSEDLAGLHPTQCELTYINTMSVGEQAWSLENITPLWRGDECLVGGTDFENTTINMRRILNDTEGVPRGRLYINFTPVYLPTDGEFNSALRLEITTRLRPTDDTIEAAFEALDVARETGVRAFSEVTRRDLQETWGRSGNG